MEEPLGQVVFDAVIFLAFCKKINGKLDHVTIGTKIGIKPPIKNKGLNLKVSGYP